MAVEGARIGETTGNDHRELVQQLENAIRQALPQVRRVSKDMEQLQGRYEAIARVLVDLRHQFQGPDGESCDLRGRSHGYRNIVREAYMATGADWDRPIAKQLTAGVAYWVRKLLVDRYGIAKLVEMGVLRNADRRRLTDLEAMLTAMLEEDADACLAKVVSLLNLAATDSRIAVTEDVVRAAVRAVHLLTRRLSRPLHAV